MAKVALEMADQQGEPLLDEHATAEADRRDRPR
jgi:hypothetical protein